MTWQMDLYYSYRDCSSNLENTMADRLATSLMAKIFFTRKSVDERDCAKEKRETNIN